MYTVTSQLTLKVRREDDGVPVICQVEHPAVTGTLQTQRYLEVQCEYPAGRAAPAWWGGPRPRPRPQRCHVLGNALFLGHPDTSAHLVLGARELSGTPPPHDLGTSLPAQRPPLLVPSMGRPAAPWALRARSSRCSTPLRRPFLSPCVSLQHRWNFYLVVLVEK